MGISVCNSQFCHEAKTTLKILSLKIIVVEYKGSDRELIVNFFALQKRDGIPGKK